MFDLFFAPQIIDSLGPNVTLLLLMFGQQLSHLMHVLCLHGPNPRDLRGVGQFV